MFSRQVDDIMIGTLSTILLYMYLLSSLISSISDIPILVLVIIVFSTFLHMILKQLNRISKQHSQYLALIQAIFISIYLILSIAIEPKGYEGFWSFFGLPFGITYYLLIGLIILFIVDTIIDPWSIELI